MNDKKHTTLSIWLPNEEADWFKRMAEKKNKSISVFLNEVLDEYKRSYDTTINIHLESELIETKKDDCLTFFF